MRIPFLLCLLSLIVSPVSSWSQDTSPNSLGPGQKRAHFAPRHAVVTKSRRTKVQHTAQYEFYRRVEQAAREKQKILKKLHKAQFSDPRFFGHKRIPRRHSYFKMRYCRECGIRH